MGKLVYLDDFRPVTTENMRCLFCGMVHVLRHVTGTKTPYFPCPGCDETASVPEWSVEAR